MRASGCDAGDGPPLCPEEVRLKEDVPLLRYGTGLRPRDQHRLDRISGRKERLKRKSESRCDYSRTIECSPTLSFSPDFDWAPRNQEVLVKSVVGLGFICSPTEEFPVYASVSAHIYEGCPSALVVLPGLLGEGCVTA